MEDISPMTNGEGTDRAVKRVAGSAQYFDQRESVCCGGKLIHWFGRVSFSAKDQDLASSTCCLVCGKPCDTRLNSEYRAPQTKTGAQT